MATELPDGYGDVLQEGRFIKDELNFLLDIGEDILAQGTPAEGRALLERYRRQVEAMHLHETMRRCCNMMIQNGEYIIVAWERVDKEVVREQMVRPLQQIVRKTLLPSCVEE